ncbi:MAG TPA: hypothetical protein VKR30_06190 [Candidatus Limnocylindrales bacterium]|nr:hypothetical protein [Candidatus Limnocylindrales bacterium]
MTKHLVTRLFIGGIAAVASGIVLATFAVIWAFASGGFVTNGPDVVGFNGSTFMWSLMAVIVAAGFTIVGGFIAGLVAWIGALLNTIQLEDKTWFIVLLVLGLLSFGFVAMIAYVIAGPDSTKPTAEARFSVNIAAHA